jgi:hypothetical protein
MESSTLCYCGQHANATPRITSNAGYTHDIIASSSQRGYNVDNSAHNSDTSSLGTTFTIPHDQFLCQACASRILSSQIARYKDAKEAHHTKQLECRNRLLATRIGGDESSNSQHNTNSFSHTHPLPDPNQINHRVSQLKQRLEMLRHHSSKLAIQVTSKTVENDEREERLEMNSAIVYSAEERLERLRQNLLLCSTTNSLSNMAVSIDEKKDVDNPIQTNNNTVGGGLRDALVSGTRQIQSLRFQYAVRVFDMHRIDVGEKYSNQSKDESSTSKKSSNVTTASGVGKIGGLPLPNAGPALYGVLPPSVLASSLRLVASLTNLVARCLGVVLPHPILGCSRECVRCGVVFNFGGDVIDLVSVEDGHEDDKRLCGTCQTELYSFNSTTKNDQRGPRGTKMQPPVYQKQPHQTAPKSSLFKFVGSSARKALALATGSAVASSYPSNTNINVQHLSSPARLSPTKQKSSASSSVSMSPDAISRRINHSSFAVLLENSEAGATEYVLNPPRWKEESASKGSDETNSNGDQSTLGSDGSANPNKSRTANTAFSNREDFHIAEERFATGLMLLQNDVVALCFRAGVDVSTLWPAESVLLNLNVLWRHCQQMVEAK